MLPDHPSTQELESFLCRPRSPGRAARNARVVRHLLAECPACHEQLRSLGWSCGRIDGLLLFHAGRLRAADREPDCAGAAFELRAAPRLNYDRAFANAHRFIVELLDLASGDLGDAARLAALGAARPRGSFHDTQAVGGHTGGATPAAAASAP